MIFVASLSPSFPVIYPTITSHRFILWKSYLLGSFSLKTNELLTLTILQTEHLFSAPFSPQEIQNSASMKPTWPVMAWVNTDRAVGSLPCDDGRKHDKKTDFKHRNTNQEKVDIQIRINQIQCLSESLNIFSRLTISTGAILRTSCCSRVASQ